jgi:rfaE bifunctional protein kinase chain/domain
MSTPESRFGIEDVEALLLRTQAVPVAVIGDAMLDRFVHGRVDRISPEAPVPVVHVRHEESRLGGAANVAANVAALGANALLFSAVGEDADAAQLRSMLIERNIDDTGVIVASGRATTVKTRILAGHQQVVRIDHETKAPLPARDCDRLLGDLKERGPFGAIVVSDYGKGVIGPELMDQLRADHAAGALVLVDPKQADFSLYRGVTAITPNEREAASASHAGIDSEEDAVRVGRQLKDRLANDMLLLTRGEHGMMLFGADGGVTPLPAVATEVFDVTGAGDTVIAVFATMLAAGAEPVLAAMLANLAAGLVVRELGTAVVRASQLAAAWHASQGRG